MLEYTNLADTNLSMCSAEKLDLSNSDLSPWAETRGTSGAAGIWTKDSSADSTELLGSLNSPFSAVVLTFQHGSISPSLQTEKSVQLPWSYSKQRLTMGVNLGHISSYPDGGTSSVWLQAFSFWHNAFRRTRWSGFLIPIPVFRISDWTLYSLMRVFMPGTWVTRTWEEKNGSLWLSWCGITTK